MKGKKKMGIRVAICDDNLENLEQINKYIFSYQVSRNVNFETKEFHNAQELLEAYVKAPFNIVLTDIEMPGIDGIELARLIRQKNHDTFIVFITSYPQYMYDSFEVQPFRYLMKPLQYELFEKIMVEIMKRMNTTGRTIMVETRDGENHLLGVDDILYITNKKNEKHILKFKLKDGELEGKGRISALEASLQKFQFVSPSRGTLLNMRYVKRFDNSKITLKNYEVIPISRRRLTNIQDSFSRYVINLMEE